MRFLLKTVLSLAVGLFTAFLLVIAVEAFSAVVHPFPEGFDHTPEEICRHVANYPPWVLAAVIPLWGGTAWLSAWLTGKLGNLGSVAILSTLLLAAVITNIAMLPYPIWFSLATPLVVLLALAQAARPTWRRLSHHQTALLSANE